MKHLASSCATVRLANYDWVFCTYEHLYTRPVEESQRILSRLGLKQTWTRRRAIRKLSRVTYSDSPLRAGKDVLTEWKNSFSAAELADMAAILGEFEIDLYSMDEPLPNQQVYHCLQKQLS